MSFVHLHTHSHYSLLDGLNKIDGLLGKATAHKMPAMALTDHGAMYGVVEFYQKATEAGVKPILGVEAYVARRSHTDRDPRLDSKPYHLTLLARNSQGYKNLIKLVSIAHLAGFYYKPRIDKDLLAAHGEGLIILTGCLQSELARTIRDNRLPDAKELLQFYMQAVGREHVFLEIQDHPALEEQRLVNGAIETLGRDLNLPLVATGDSHYLNHDDQDAHEVLLAVSTGKDVDDKERMTLKDVDLSLASPKEMATRFSGFGAAVENTLKVAEQVDLTFNWHNILPKFPLPQGKQQAQAYFEELAWAGLQRRLGQPSPEAEERLRYELGVIEKMGFADYFLIVQDFVNWAKSQGIVVGPGRGSAAGSLASYCIGITGLNPLTYGLLFERFLNPARVSMPDIDIDIADDRRDEVLRYVQGQYGEDRVAQIITFGTMAARGSIRDVARALGLGFADGDRIAKLIPGKPGTTLKGALDSVNDLKAIYDTEPTMKQLIDMAMKLEGVARHASTHACGVVIADAPLTEYLPLTTNQKGPMTTLTQFGMGDCETIGLLKMDFLGLSNLTVIKNALRIIRKRHALEIDIDTIPLDDAATFALLSRAETTGVFQLESEGMKRYLRELKPTQFEDIIAMVALYRPGPMDLIPDYIAGKHGRKQIAYLDPTLEPILKTTYGVGVYQEQIMEIATAFAGFSLGEGYLLIKGIAKKIKKIVDQQKEKFIESAVTQGRDRGTAEQLFALIEPFARYGFNKSHAACYAMIAYQTAYLKAHYPAEFMAALMTSDIHNLDRISIEINEATHMGLHVLPPSVNESFVEFGVVERDGNTPGVSSDSPGVKEEPVQNVAIRFGLAAIKNVGDAVAEAMVEERQAHGRFVSLEDLLSRLPAKQLNRKSLESLAMAGAFDELGERQQILDNMDTIVKFISTLEKQRTSAQASLFGSEETQATHQLHLHLVAGTAATKQQRLSWEKELLSVYVSEHPLDEHREKLGRIETALSDLAQRNEGDLVTVGGILIDVRQITTKSGEPMAFAKLEDYTGTSELVVFPRTFKESPALWQSDQVLLVKGKVSDRNNERSLIVDSAKPLGEAIVRAKKSAGNSAARRHPESVASLVSHDPGTARELHLLLDNACDRGVLEQVKLLLTQTPGETPVYCTIVGPSSRRISTSLTVAMDDTLLSSLQSQLGPERILVVH
ncbi:DNA polymerase III subunit alpha [Candidatus Berkelbacteria bacterium]|nr:DNA polymerase III subunit alpha [Candidatus Berkelbacteria bacterium]